MTYLLLFLLLLCKRFHVLISHIHDIYVPKCRIAMTYGFRQLIMYAIYVFLSGYELENKSKNIKKKENCVSANIHEQVAKRTDNLYISCYKNYL